MPRLYNIPLRGIKEGHHTFKFEIDRKFFDLFEGSEVREGELEAVAEVEKCSSHINLDILIYGKVTICCDRCLEVFDHPIECENRLLVKFGHEMDDSDPEIITLSRDDHELDLKQYLYEFIHLALPIRRIHPDDEYGISRCNPEMLLKLREHQVDEVTFNDPGWEELGKLMNDN